MDDNEALKGMREVLSELPGNLSELMRGRLEQPEVKAILSRQQAAHDRGPLAFAFVQGRLPPDVVTVIRLGEPLALTDYALVAAASFDDEVFQRAIGNARVYFIERGFDALPAEIVVMTDGAVDFSDAASGRLRLTQNQLVAVADPRRNSGPILSALDSARVSGSIEVRRVRDYGMVEVVRREN